MNEIARLILASKKIEGKSSSVCEVKTYFQR